MNSTQSRRLFHHSFSLIALLISVLTLPLITYLVQKEQDIRQEAESPPISFLISSSTPSAIPGQSFVVSIDVDTKEKPITQVSFTLTYPADKLAITHIDSTNTAFDTDDEQLSGNGFIRVSRKTNTPVNGQAHIIGIAFNAKENAFPNEITLAADSKVTGIDDSTLIATSQYVDPSTIQVETNKTGFVDILLAKNMAFWDWFFSKVPILDK